MITKFVFFLLINISLFFSVNAVTNKPLELIILHNSDMHARFEQTGVYSNLCREVDASAGECYGGFGRVSHMYD